MDTNDKKVPVTLMFNQQHHNQLKAISKTTCISMSELVRLSVERLVNELGDAENIDSAALLNLLGIKS